MIKGEMNIHEEAYTPSNSRQKSYYLDDDLYGFAGLSGFSLTDMSALQKELDEEIEKAKLLGFTPGVKVFRVKDTGEIITNMEGIILGYANALPKAMSVSPSSRMTPINVQWKTESGTQWNSFYSVDDITKVITNCEC